MRDKNGVKRGALTLEQCVGKATALIAEHGICLLIVDIVHSSSRPFEDQQKQYRLLDGLRVRATELFGDHMPEHSPTAVGRVEQGFTGGFGDAAWAAIDDPSVVMAVAELKDREFPELELHYGVAADGWSDGIELVG